MWKRGQVALEVNILRAKTAILLDSRLSKTRAPGLPRLQDLPWAPCKDASLASEVSISKSLHQRRGTCLSP
jgi:hypothetical protein